MIYTGTMRRKSYAKKNRYQRMIAILDLDVLTSLGECQISFANGLLLAFLDDNLHCTTNTVITLQSEAEVILARCGI